MSDGANDKSPTDPTDLWKQWYNTSSKVWSNGLDSRKETYMDPYGLYQGWLKSMQDVQERLKAHPFGVMDPKEAWRVWFEAMTDGWRKAAEMGGDPLGLMARWLEMMEEARANMQSGEGIPSDPFTFFKQWYDAASETWAEAVGSVIGTEQFMEGVRQFIESYTSSTRTFRRASEEYFRTLQLPTRSDIARVAELVVNLEEKVDRIEDAVEEFEDGQVHMAKSEEVATIEERLEEVEGKLNTFPTILKSAEEVENLAKRLDQLEGKVDKVLSVLTKIDAMERAQASKPANLAPRKTTKKNKDQPGTKDLKLGA